MAGHGLHSADLVERARALAALYVAMRPKLIAYFYAWTGNIDDAHDLLGELFLRIFAYLVDRPLPAQSEPEAYIWGSARNLLIDRHRRNTVHRRVQRAYDALTSDRKRPLRPVEDSLELQAVQSLYEYLPDEIDRVLAVLHWTMGLKPQFLANLAGWHADEMRRALRSNKRRLRTAYHMLQDVVMTPSRWEKRLSFSQSNYPMGITWGNVRPMNIAHDSERELLRDAGVGSTDQLFERYAVLLRIDQVLGPEPSLRLALTERSDLSKGLFRETSVAYIEYTPVPRRLRVNGGWKEVIDLVERVEYSATTVNKYYNERGDWIGVEWDMPALGVSIDKAISGKLVHLAVAPSAREESIGVYRVRRIHDSHDG